MKITSLTVQVILILFMEAQGEATGQFAHNAATGSRNYRIKKSSQSHPHRNIIIQINNVLDTSIHKGQSYLQWGKFAKPPASVIKGRAKESILFENNSGGINGTGGILTYDIGTEDEPVRFAIVFSLTHGYPIASNWFGIEFISPSQSVDNDLYTQIVYNLIWSQEEKQRSYAYDYERNPVEVTFKGYIVKATMSNRGLSFIKVELMKQTGSGLGTKLTTFSSN